ncbi:unnamed protein product [Rangifer tarandus platyrhynchus]|uniref:Uncharacterized protein n=1 Tax=Rangifer tarandus platyrhynchus TaxID=3082113 RepID=A0AC59YRZ2_RANTA
MMSPEPPWNLFFSRPRTSSICTGPPDSVCQMTEQGLLSKRKPTPDFQRHLNAENYYEEQIKLDQRTGEVREGRLQGPLRGLVPAGTQLAKEAGLGTTSEADGSWRSGIWQPRRIEWKERVRVFQREEQFASTEQSTADRVAETAEMCHITLAEPGSPRSRGKPGLCLWRLRGSHCATLLPASRDLVCFLDHRGSTPISAFIFMWPPPSAHVSLRFQIYPLKKDVSHTGLESTL